MSRDKAKPRTLVWDTSGGNKGDSVVLPTPDNDEEGEGAYTVEVTVNYSAPQAIYRSGVDTQLAKLDPAEQSQYRYSAILRPRGYECPDLQKLPSIFWVLRRLFDGDRCYVDIPLDLLALRFPAKVADLNSDDGNVADGNRYIQSSILRTGIEVVVEPWDYDRAHARIPVRFVAGLSLFDLGAGKFSPSLVTGLQLTLDRIGTGTASSAVTLGFMYELDLREPDRGSHFLFTSSINFLSLHAAQADQQH